MTLHHHDQHQRRPDIVSHRWFPGHPNSVREVRRFIADRLNTCPRTNDAVLLASELATNALQHTRSAKWSVGFHVTIEHTEGQTVRITIHDAGSHENTPHVTTPEPDGEHGRGLHLVNTLATKWGSHVTFSGRRT
ncbi:ATP-binding protein [Allosalinactinospora lopnorensis]|uniref:ATP-binding protein n=1 Tax=Allosalinactinospora lopnorensis TaxID=1352348 RepID=UPI000623E0F8|nr:ATP-binding protein [Allosalinactinospora lopnorensis]